MSNLSSMKVVLGRTQPSTDEAWAEMLGKVGTNLCRLDAFVETHQPKRPKGDRRSSILLELEKERARIGRELHAGAGQPLSGIKLNLEILRELALGLPDSAQQALVRLETLAEQALQQVRAVSHRLHPPAWQELSVAAAVRNLIETCGLEAHYRMEVAAEEFDREPSHSVKVAIYRCTQECLSNIVRHSGATAIRVHLSEEPDFVILEVADNGHGFEPVPDQAGESRTSAGIGLKALSEHAAGVGGICEVSSGVSGTTIVVKIPRDEDE